MLECANYPWKKGVQKRRCFFAARGGIWRFRLFSRWLSERQIMNEHPCARAPPQPLHFLSTPCRPAPHVPTTTTSLSPSRIPPPMSTGGRSRMPPTQPGTSWDTSIVPVIFVILDIARYAHPIESRVSRRSEQARTPNPFENLKSRGITFSYPVL